MDSAWFQEEARNTTTLLLVIPRPTLQSPCRKPAEE
jgi:hypothetical protein